MSGVMEEYFSDMRHSAGAGPAGEISKPLRF